MSLSSLSSLSDQSAGPQFCDCQAFVDDIKANGTSGWVENGAGLPSNSGYSTTENVDWDWDGANSCDPDPQGKLRVYGGRSWSFTVPDVTSQPCTVENNFLETAPCPSDFDISGMSVTVSGSTITFDVTSDIILPVPTVGTPQVELNAAATAVVAGEPRLLRIRLILDFVNNNVSMQLQAFECVATCTPRMDINSVQVYNPDWVSLTNSTTGSTNGVMTFDPLERMYSSDNNTVIVPLSESEFPWPAIDGLQASVNLPSEGVLYEGSSAPSGPLGYSFILIIPYTGTINTLYGGVFHSVTSNDIVLEFRAETLSDTGSVVTLRITIAGYMDPWPDGSSYFGDLVAADIRYFSAGFRNYLRDALAIDDTCDARFPNIEFGLNVLVDPMESTPWRVQVYAPSIEFAE